MEEQEQGGLVNNLTLLKVQRIGSCEVMIAKVLGGQDT